MPNLKKMWPIIFILVLIFGQLVIINLLPVPFYQFDLIMVGLVLKIIFGKNKKNTIWLAMFAGITIELFSSNQPGIYLFSLMAAVLGADWILENLFSKQSAISTATTTTLALTIKTITFYLTSLLVNNLTWNELTGDNSLIFIQFIKQAVFTILLTLLIYSTISILIRRVNPRYIIVDNKNFYG